MALICSGLLSDKILNHAYWCSTYTKQVKVFFRFGIKLLQVRFAIKWGFLHWMGHILLRLFFLSVRQFVFVHTHRPRGLKSGVFWVYTALTPNILPQAVPELGRKKEISNFLLGHFRYEDLASLLTKFCCNRL